jgi:hypothetical protein
MPNLEGQARLLIIQNPELRYQEAPNKTANPVIYGYGSFEEPGNGGVGTLGGFRRVPSTLQLLASTANVPSGVLDGFSLDGAKAVRLELAAEGGQTLTSGTIYLHVGSPISVLGTPAILWKRNVSLEWSFTGGTRQIITVEDLPVLFPWGRMFIECNNFVASGGTNVNVSAWLWGLS